MAIAKRLSTRTCMIPRFSFSLPVRFLLPRGNYALMVLNLRLVPITSRVKSNVLQLYCVIFNCCRLFKIAKTANFLLRFCAIEGGERRENGVFRGPRRLVSEKHCRSQPMDQTHTHTCTTLVQDTRLSCEIRNSKKRTVIGKSEGVF